MNRLLFPLAILSLVVIFSSVVLYSCKSTPPPQTDNSLNERQLTELLYSDPDFRAFTSSLQIHTVASNKHFQEVYQSLSEDSRNLYIHIQMTYSNVLEFEAFSTQEERDLVSRLTLESSSKMGYHLDNLMHSLEGLHFDQADFRRALTSYPVDRGLKASAPWECTLICNDLFYAKWIKTYLDKVPVTNHQSAILSADKAARFTLGEQMFRCLGNATLSRGGNDKLL